MRGRESTHYEILDISKDATEEQIKKAYRKLTLQFHPDKNPDNPIALRQFQAVNEAYAILIDPERRAEYDATLIPSELENVEAELAHLDEQLYGKVDKSPQLFETLDGEEKHIAKLKKWEEQYKHQLSSKYQTVELLTSAYLHLQKIVEQGKKIPGANDKIKKLVHQHSELLNAYRVKLFEMTLTETMRLQDFVSDVLHQKDLGAALHIRPYNPESPLHITIDLGDDADGRISDRKIKYVVEQLNASQLGHYMVFPPNSHDKGKLERYFTFAIDPEYYDHVRNERLEKKVPVVDATMAKENPMLRSHKMGLFNYLDTRFQKGNTTFGIKKEEKVEAAQKILDALSNRETDLGFFSDKKTSAAIKEGKLKEAAKGPVEYLHSKKPGK